MAEAVQQAAKDLNIDIVWGAAWNVSLTYSDEDPRTLSEDYSKTRRSQGRSVFIDGPHFELNRSAYKDE